MNKIRLMQIMKIWAEKLNDLLENVDCEEITPESTKVTYYCFTLNQIKQYNENIFKMTSQLLKEELP